MNKVILINGQWQGGGSLDTYTASLQLKQFLRVNYNLHSVPIDTKEPLALENGIIGSQVIQKQIHEALHILNTTAPERLITIGGGCDADVASIAYLNDKYQGDLAVIWMDGHSDINAPAESESHLFYGMPIRSLLGECPSISDMVSRPLEPEQVILFGSQDMDPSEVQYVSCHPISHIPVLNHKEELRNQLQTAIDKTGRHHVYIHLDLDVLDPLEFPYTPLPVKDGYSLENLHYALQYLMDTFNVMGMGIFEYIAQENLPDELKRILDFIKYL